jgi:glycine cleavage system H protein
MSIPDDVKYTPHHEWLRRTGDLVKVGITAFAASALGDVVHVELPAVGTRVRSGAVCGEIESTKSVSDLYSPCDGEIVAVNAAVTENPEVVNADPYGAGWLFTVRMVDAPELLDSTEYAALIDGGVR